MDCSLMPGSYSSSLGERRIGPADACLWLLSDNSAEALWKHASVIFFNLCLYIPIFLIFFNATVTNNRKCPNDKISHWIVLRLLEKQVWNKIWCNKVFYTNRWHLLSTLYTIVSLLSLVLFLSSAIFQTRIFFFGLVIVTCFKNK